MSEYTKISTPALIGCALLILLFITKPLYSSYYEWNISIVWLTEKQQNLQKKYDDLKSMDTNLSSDRTNDPKIKLLKDQVIRYQKSFNPNEIMELVLMNSFTSPDPTTGEYNLVVTNITIGSGTKLPNGLSKASVSISTEVKSIDFLLNYITYLLKSEKVALGINTISLPIDTADMTEPPTWGYSIPLEFELYYYE